MLSSALLGSVLLSFVAQEPAPQELLSGPLAGVALQPVRVYAESGDRKGQEFDAIPSLGKSSGALLFIHDLSRNTAPLIRAFSELGAEFADRGFAGWCVLLAEDRNAAETRLAAVNGSLKMARPIVLSLDGLEGPGSYALNRRCTLTLVTARDGKVVRSVAFTDTGAADAPKVRAWIEELLPPEPTPEEQRARIAAELPSDPEALKRLAIERTLELEALKKELATLRAQRAAGAGGREGMRGERPKRESAREGEMREAPPAGESEGRGGETPRREAETPPAERPAPGKAPEDAELANFLRALIRKDASDERAKELMASVETRAAQSEKLRAEAVAMFERVLHYGDRYGSENARALMRAFVAARK